MGPPRPRSKFVFLKIFQCGRRMVVCGSFGKNRRLSLGLHESRELCCCVMEIFCFACGMKSYGTDWMVLEEKSGQMGRGLFLVQLLCSDGGGIRVVSTLLQRQSLSSCI